jgi:hypothetical protein
MKFVGRMAKKSWLDYKTNEDILLELKIDPVVKKIQNYRRENIQHIQSQELIMKKMVSKIYKLYGAVVKKMNGTVVWCLM